MINEHNAVDDGLVEARKWLAAQIERHTAAVEKAKSEISYFEAGGDEWQPFAKNWRKNLIYEKGVLATYQSLNAIVVDRDEWYEQHENLLAMYRAQATELADMRRISAELVDLMANEVNSRPVSMAWNTLRLALLPYRAALEQCQSHGEPSKL